MDVAWFWYFALFAVLSVFLVGIAWSIWQPQIRAWLIPHSDIAQSAHLMIETHGAENALKAALANNQSAMEARNLFEAARWERICDFLQKNLRPASP